MAAKSNGRSRKKSVEPTRVKFDYLKSNFFRVIQADGVWGGISHRGRIQMGFYSERPAIPQQITHEIDESGRLGSEVEEERVARDAIIREVEISIVMDLGTAIVFRDWLNAHVKNLEKILQEAKKEQPTKKRKKT